MTTNHPVPTPPPSEPAPSLRPVEELQALCDAAPQSGPWRYQLFNGVDRVICEADAPDFLVAEFALDSDAMLAAGAVNALPSLLARLRAAEETLAAVGEELRDLAEQHLYDGDTDRPLNAGYHKAFDLADRLESRKATN